MTQIFLHILKNYRDARDIVHEVDTRFFRALHAEAALILPPVGRPSRAGGKRRAKPSATSRRAHGRSKGRGPARRLPPLSQPLPATGSRT